MKTPKPFVVLWALVLLLSPTTARAEFTIQPYIQNPGKTTMTVMWESDARSEGSVTLRRGDDAPVVVPAEGPVETPEGYEEPPYLYAVELTGLQAGTTYTYTVTSGKDVSRSSHFTTFPETAESFTFIAYGDSRSHPANHKEIGANFSKYKPAFILHSGDFVGNGRVREQWKRELFDPLAEVMDHIPLFGARGNHEADGVLMDFYLSPPDGKFHYSFDYGEAHFAFHQANNPSGLNWVDKDLAATKATWKFAIYHYPSFNLGGHSSSWGLTNLLPLLRKNKVDVTITGHSHLYERFHPLAPLNTPNAHPITHIVSGGGGAGLYGGHDHPSLAKTAVVRHFLVVKVNPESVRIDAREADDSLLDSFTIDKKDGVYDEAYRSSVMPEEAVSLYKLLHGNRKGRGNKLHARIASLPKPGEPVDLAISYTGPALQTPLKGVLTLSKEYQDRFRLEPAEAPLSVVDQEKSNLSFRLVAEKDIKLVKDLPDLPVLDFRCQVGKVKLTIASKVELSAPEPAEPQK